MRRLRLCAYAAGVSFPEGGRMRVDLADGRTVLVPLVWFPRLARAASSGDERLLRVEIAGHGALLRWEGLGQEIFVEALLSADEIAVGDDGP